MKKTLKDIELENFINEALFGKGATKPKAKLRTKTAIKRYLWHNKTDWHLEEIKEAKGDN